MKELLQAPHTRSEVRVGEMVCWVPAGQVERLVQAGVGPGMGLKVSPAWHGMHMRSETGEKEPGTGVCPAEQLAASMHWVWLGRGWKALGGQGAQGVAGAGLDVPALQA